MKSFRIIVTLIGLLIIGGGVFLILNGMWPLGKAGDEPTGMNIPVGAEVTAENPPERSRDMFHHYETPAPLPPLMFYAADTQPVRFDRWRGQKLIVNLWATWCAPCVDELPYLDNLKSEISGRGFDVIAISLDRQKDFAGVEAFMNKLNIQNLETYVDQQSQFMRKLELRSFPLTLILNEEGNIIAQHQGPLKWDDPQVIQALMQL